MSVPKSFDVILLPHSAPSWILSLAENLASSNLQDGATKWHYNGKEPSSHPATHPASQPSPAYISIHCIYDMCGVPPPPLNRFRTGIAPERNMSCLVRRFISTPRMLTI